jgi:hypothetical protein
MTATMKTRIAQPLAIFLILACVLPAGCSRKSDAAKTPTPPPASPESASHAAAPPTLAASPAIPDGPPDWIGHPQMTPGTVSLSAVDPHDMTPSERQFGRAPKLSPEVDYQPGVIIMEEGDKAIKSIASDGITWTFDANAPHVSEFQTGKIVFATGRAVGKILGMTRNGSDVSVYLGPILLTDVIKRGRFVMDQPIDPDKIISYVAPDFPGANDTTLGKKSAMLDRSVRGSRETVLISRPSNGKWIPAAMSSTDGEGRRTTWRRSGRHWTIASTRGRPQGLTIPQGAQRPVTLPPLDVRPTRSINVDNGNSRIEAVANRTFLGNQYYFNGPGGVNAYAGGLVTLEAPVVRCVLKFSNGGIDSAGISIVGAAGVRLRLDSHSPASVFINMNARKMVPLDLSIQLGGPLPFSLTFAMLLDLNSGFSAKTSLMVAEGEYRFSGGIWAGRAGGAWTYAAPTNITPVTNLGSSLAGVSLGINSFTLSFGIRSTVGIGAFGFNTGVFAQVRFGGGLALTPNETFQCRQATIETFLDTGLGWAIPQWAANVINLFLKAVSARPIDAVGTLAAGPTTRMFHGFDQIPTGCSGHPSG